MAGFLAAHAGVHPSADQRMLGWVEEDRLVIVVGLSGFMGKIAVIHIAFAPGWHFSPRAMLDAVFRYAFGEAKRELLIGLVNSKNDRAMRFDRHLGFTELFRLPEMHDDDGDLVVFGMRPDQCRYLNAEEKEDAHAVHVGLA